jgi:cyclic pyranopterin phosphate synthase
MRDKLNRPLHDLRISVTDRCNFRCPYCMPEEATGHSYRYLDRSELLSFEEIVRVVSAAARLGARKIRITGGEPLLRQELSVLVGMLTQIDGIDDLALTTNGALMADQALSLKKAGLDRVTVSLDALDGTVFRKMSGGRGEVGAVLEGIRVAEEAGFSSFKINAVVQRGMNEEEIVPLAGHFRGTGHVVRFIEYMDVGNLNGWSRDRVVPAREILDRIGSVWPLEPVEGEYRGEVARRWRYLDGAGQIGLIASVSAPFCADCTRLRLSADGKLYTCLFASRGTDVRGLLRSGGSDEALELFLSSVWGNRTDRYSEERFRRDEGGSSLGSGPGPGSKVEMFRVGG